MNPLSGPPFWLTPSPTVQPSSLWAYPPPSLSQFLLTPPLILIPLQLSVSVTHLPFCVKTSLLLIPLQSNPAPLWASPLPPFSSCLLLLIIIPLHLSVSVTHLSFFVKPSLLLTPLQSNPAPLRAYPSPPLQFLLTPSHH